MNAVKREARSLLLPASVGLAVGAVWALTFINSMIESADTALMYLFGSWIEEIEFIPIALFIVPPIIQLALLGAEVPRELDYAVLILSRSRSRTKWLALKLTFIALRSLVMSACMMLPMAVLIAVKGASAGEHAAGTVTALFLTWMLCQCMFVLWSNVLGLWLKPSICVIALMLVYAMGLTLFLGNIPGYRLWPSVQGMLYAHDFILGKSDSGGFTPLLSAAYCAVSAGIAVLLGMMRIRRMDLL